MVSGYNVNAAEDAANASECGRNRSFYIFGIASEGSVNGLWEAFNDIAEGFGLNKLEMLDICSIMQDSLGMKSRTEMDAYSTKLFVDFDTDENGLVDALEFLATMAMVSSMKLAEKLTFVFNCYDFNESSEITIDELTLSLKSTLTGLCKMTVKNACPTEAELEQVSIKAFSKAEKQMDDNITLMEFIKFCQTTPEIIGWLEFHDDPDVFAELYDLRDSDVEREAEIPVYSVMDALVQDPDFVHEMKFQPGEAQTFDAAGSKPWTSTIANAVPSNPPEINDTTPATNLHLEWIYGYSNDIRSSVQYISSGEIAYPAASSAVVYDIVDHSQRFFMDHVDAVLCMAVSPSGNIIATAERGKKPRICIWDPNGSTAVDKPAAKVLDAPIAETSMTQICCIRGFHNSGVGQLSWAPNEKSLISVGLDKYHQVAVYTWKTKALQGCPILEFAHASSIPKVLACHFTNNDEFVTCGIKHIYFWHRVSSLAEPVQVFQRKKGCLGKKAKMQTFVSLSSINDATLAGTIRGDIYVWNGRSCTKILHAHAECVNSIYSFGHAFVSGGKDGKVRIWSQKYESGAQFDVQALGSYNPHVRSVCANADGTKLLIGTAGCEIYEIAASDGCNLHFGPLITGHCRKELWGLSMNPKKSEACTVGDDQTIRIWDIEAHRMLRMVQLDAGSRSCAYSPDGMNIAVGFGCEPSNDYFSNNTLQLEKHVPEKKEGAFAILNEATLVVEYEARDSKKWIRDIKFSADGSTLGVASQDQAIYLYNTGDYASKGKCRKHSSHVTNFDFSSDCAYLQSNCGKHELLFYDANTGSEVSRASDLKDVEWATCNCPLGWATQGIWAPQKFVNKLNVNTVDRYTDSKNTALIISGDNYGRIRLYRYPCITKGSAYFEFRGHVTNIRNVRFHPKFPYVLSCGGDDRCIFQWRMENDQPEAEAGVYEDNINSEDELDNIDGAQMDRTLLQELSNKGDYAVDIMLELEPESSKDSFVPVKPWYSSAVAPTRPDDHKEEINPDLMPVKNNLVLDWVYGYRAQDSRNNIAYNSEGHVIYPAATVVIIYDKKLHAQKFFRGHTDNVISIALHPDETIVATGQVGKHPLICLWNSVTLETLRILQGFHERAVNSLSFSNDGVFLASTGQDQDHALALYDWKNGVLKASTKADSSNKILSVAIRPIKLNQSRTGSTVVMVTAGVFHLKFWSLESGRFLTSKNALIGKKGLKQTYPCVVFMEENAVAGTANGQLYLFNGRDLHTSVIAHVRSVTALQSCNQGLCSGGKDGYVKLWSLDFECIAEFNMDMNTPIEPKIRAVYWSSTLSTIIVGMRGGEIFEVSAVDGVAITNPTLSLNDDFAAKSDANDKLCQSLAIVTAHFGAETWCLDTHPETDDICSVGDDKTLRVWDSKKHRQKYFTMLDTPSRACAYSPDGNYVAVGLGGSATRGKHKKDGTFLIFQADTLSLIHEARDTKQWITCLQFSKDGLTLVVGSYDNCVYIYDVSNDYSKRSTFTKHQSFITHVDISTDGQYLRSTCGGSELFFADVTTGSHIASASALKNQTWNTSKCVFNYDSQGIWPSTKTNTLVNATARSNCEDSLISGDNFGKLKLFKYPCVNPGAPFKLYSGHSAEVRCISFNKDDGIVFSVGGTDRCIFQWKYFKDNEDDGTRKANIGDDDSDLEVESMFGPSVLGDVDNGNVPVKSYLGAMVPPSNVPVEILDAPPAIDFELDYVHGFRSQDVRNNLSYSASGRIVYHAASVGISYDRNFHQQTFYKGHVNREIISLQVSYDGRFVATGEVCARPRIHIWEATSCAFVSMLPAFHENAVTYLSFSPCGQYLCSIGQDENHSLCVWQSSKSTNSVAEWEHPKVLAYSKNTIKKVLFVVFRAGTPTISNPTFAGSTSSAYDIVSGGVDHVMFWKIDAPGLIGVRGIFGNKATLQPIPCGAVVNQRAVTGTVTGHLYLWDSRSVYRVIPGHTGTVNAIYSTSPNGALTPKISTPRPNTDTSLTPYYDSGCVTGGLDGHVKLWSKEITPLADFDISDAKPSSFNPTIRSVCWDLNLNRILVGTRASEIYELSCHGGNSLLLQEGHCEDELFALAPHPTNTDLFVSGGDDKTIRVWSISKRDLVGKLLLDTAVKSVCWSPDGAFIAAGLGGSTSSSSSQRKDGAFAIVDANTMEIVHEGRESKKCLGVLKYSPNGSLLVTGSHDTIVYIHDVLDNYKLRAKCDKGTGQITHFDFSTDSSYLRVNTDAYELIFVNTLDGSWVPSPITMKDTSWASESCVFSWPVQGIWPSNDDKVHIEACNRANDKDVLVCGDNSANIRVYNYPIITKEAPRHTINGHALAVSNLSFTTDDEYLLSTGNKDRSVFQWKVTKLEDVGK